MELDKISAFPSLEQANVLWVGNENNKSAAEDYYNKCLSIIKKSGIKFSRRNEFIPHITIARMKKKFGESELNLLSNIEMQHMPVKIKLISISLYESILTHEGAKYIKLLSMPNH